MCGGTILNKRYVLTAMHCLYSMQGVEHPPSRCSVVLGEHNLSDGQNEGGQVIGVEAFIIYGHSPCLFSELNGVEFVRWHGRWLAPRTLETYLQETAAVSLVPRLPAAARDRISRFASAAPELLRRACQRPRGAVVT